MLVKAVKIKEEKEKKKEELWEKHELEIKRRVDK